MGIEFQLRKRRTKKDGSITYYAEFLSDEIDGTGRRKRIAMRSMKTSSMAEAKRRAQAMIDNGEITDSRADIATFFTECWTPGESKYLVDQEMRGRTVSPTYCQHNRAWLAKYFYPYCRKHKLATLADLNSRNLNDWMVWLYQNRVDFKIGESTINKIRQAAAVPLRWTYRKEMIARDPMDRVDRVADTKGTRQPFEPQEVRALFAQEWPDPRTETACLLAASTGMRLGEVRGLRDDALHLPDGFLYVQSNWIDGEGLKQPKSKDKGRVAPLPPITVAALGEVLRENPYPSPRYVFWGDTEDEPITRHALRSDLKDAMKAAGITGRSFHSFRHFYVSYQRSKVGDARLMQTVGHTSTQITDGYSHFLEADQDVVRQSIAEAFVSEVNGN